MNQVEERVFARFEKIRHAPLMWAGTREALVAQLSMLLDMLGLDGKRLHAVHPRMGNIPIGLGDRLDEAFAETVVVAALKIKNGENP